MKLDKVFDEKFDSNLWLLQLVFTPFKVFQSNSMICENFIN